MCSNRFLRCVFLVASALATLLATPAAAGAEAAVAYDVFNPHPDLSRTADGRWSLHDLSRPLPPRVEPRPEAELAAAARPPTDARVLVGGTDLSAWRLPEPTWQLVDGALRVAPQKRDIQTRDAFGSVQLHVEWRTSPHPTRSGQDRGNSGIFLMSTYEIQILDTYNHRTYADGMAAALYGMQPPAADALRPPGEWQTYDIWFQRPIFDGHGALVRPARVTVDVNGVRVHENAAFDGPSGHRIRQRYRSHAEALPLALQDHNEEVHFRNVWIRPLPDTEQAPHLVR